MRRRRRRYDESRTSSKRMEEDERVFIQQVTAYAGCKLQFLADKARINENYMRHISSSIIITKPESWNG
jgi:hypothetical protein